MIGRKSPELNLFYSILFIWQLFAIYYGFGNGGCSRFNIGIGSHEYYTELATVFDAPNIHLYQQVHTTSSFLSYWGIEWTGN